MRKRRKIKWVVALVVSFVFMMLAPAISNHPVQAEQSSTEENQTDKPWVTSLPFVTISEYNESAGTKGKDYYRTEVTFDEEEHSVEFITAGYGGDGQPHVENNGIMFNLDPINGEGVDLSKYEYVEVDMEGTGGEAFVKLMKNSDSYWSQIDGGIFIEPVQGERQKMYFNLDYLTESIRGDRSNVQAIAVSCKALEQRVKIYGIEFGGNKEASTTATPKATMNPAYQSSCKIPLESDTISASGYNGYNSSGIYSKNSSGITFPRNCGMNYVNLENFFLANGINFSKYKYAYISYQMLEEDGSIASSCNYEAGKLTLAQKGSVNGYSDGVATVSIKGGTTSGVAEFDFTERDKTELAKAVGGNFGIWGTGADFLARYMRISQIYLTQTKGEISPPLSSKTKSTTTSKKTAVSAKKKTTYLMKPTFKIKKKKQGKIRYLQITLKKYKGTYIDIYARKKKKFKRVSKAKLRIKKYKGVFKIRTYVKHMKIDIRVRTWQKKGKKKIYSKWSKIKRVRV